MPHRLQLTPGSVAAIPACARDVYVAPFTEESGYRWVWSVSSKGVRVGLKCVPPGVDFNPYLDDLWAELDREDPVVTPDDVSGTRAFRLIA
jgi:hypothetical protein